MEADRKKALYESRSKLYADYLADLTKTRDALRLVARGGPPDGASLIKAADAAFASANIYARRYQIEITAPLHVTTVTSATVQALSEVRGSIAECGYRSYGYNAAFLTYEEALTTLIAAMTEDLKNLA